ncbi:baseplate J/gp47 family protein [Natroniella sulfidigena]|uniref:baseplate J/gp47 family protein n=1 Tax=Natroniella sulfidigena TaxID=723921 RepID=UPI00200B949F|nr:baseplate J/gp47 family protein [Natroniella sulfidigena]MCK8818091.1 baseplate J/gp47 family protein [Natroniella sulfidigena]
MLEDYVKIYIDPEEPLNSLLDKIQTVENDTLVIIVHKKSSIFVGQVNLELIKNYAQRAGKKLIFITDVTKTKKLLTKVGFEVYSDLEKIEGENEDDQKEVESEERRSLLDEDDDQGDQSDHQENKGGLFKKLIGCGAGLLLLALVWFYFSFSVATVEVTPVFETKDLSNQIKAVKEVEDIKSSENKMSLLSEELELSQEFKIETTGQQRIGVERAEGVLALINDTRQEVVIPAESEVATQNGTRFRTVNRVTVPPAEVDKFMGRVVGMKAGRAEVNIEAVDKGVAGNVSKGRIVELGDSYPVTVVNPEDTQGGADEEVSVVTREDLARGVEQLKEELRSEVEGGFEDKFSGDFLFFSDQLEIENEDVVVEAEVGDVMDEFQIVGNITATGLAVKREELKELIFELYQNNLTDNFKLADSQVIIKDIDIEEATPAEAILTVESSGQVKGKVDEDKLFSNLIAKEIVEIKNIFDKMEEIADYKIKADDRSRLPQFSFGIDLVINEPQGQ